MRVFQRPGIAAGYGRGAEPRLRSIGCNGELLDLGFERRNLLVQRLRLFGNGIMLLPGKSHIEGLTNQENHNQGHQPENERPSESEAELAQLQEAALSKRSGGLRRFLGFGLFHVFG